MELDWQVCSRARLSRDARFDGRFYIGVLTSGVYCRPICPSRTAKEENVRYFSSAAAAAEAGFRPCLRCRPECSPGTPAWFGTSNTVARALRLIGQSGLEEGVEALAERLGVGSRHLRRLFLKHLGATPTAVAQTRRLQFAKKLIDETSLPMNQVALASGFGCVRRFNASIRQVYNHTPMQIRGLVRQTAVSAENEYLFRLRFRPPYAWTSMLKFLAARLSPGVEAVADGQYLRTISLNGSRGYFEVSFVEDAHCLSVRVQFPDPSALFAIIERIRGMFDLNADTLAIVRTLRADPVLSPSVERNPGLRVPGSWDGFELTIRAILGQQQLSVLGATPLSARLIQSFGEPFSPIPHLTHLFALPAVLAKADLSSIGLSPACAETVRALSIAVCSGRLNFHHVIDTDAFLAQLGAIPGVTKATAQYIAMRALGETDAFPSCHPRLLNALNIASARDLEARSEAWRPWRAYAAMYLWTIPAASPAPASMASLLPAPDNHAYVRGL